MRLLSLFFLLFPTLFFGQEFSYKWNRVLMDSTWNYPIQNKKIDSIISVYKPKMEALMMERVAITKEEFRSSRPQSLLSNFAADAILSYSKEISQADFALTNFGGLRATMPKGDVRRYDIYSIFPFENNLVIIGLRGEDVLDLFKLFAEQRVEAISGNVSLRISKGVLKDAKIGGREIDPNKIYYVATIDFLLTGGDNLSMLKRAVSTKETGILLRDVIFSVIKRQMSEVGELRSNIDNRLIIENN